MSDDIAAEILRLEARIRRLRAQRAVLMKMQRRNGASAAPRARRADTGLVPRGGLNGGVFGAVLDCVKAARPNWLTTAQVVEGVTGHVETTPGSIRTQLYALRKKGLIKGSAEGWTVVLRRRGEAS